MHASPSGDLGVWIAELRDRRDVLDRDIAALEAALAAQADVAAIGERHGLRTGTWPLPPSVAVADAPTTPARRGSPVPRVPADAVRLSAEHIATLANEVRRMTRLAALEHIGRQARDFQSADATKVLDAAGLLSGSPRNRRTSVYHQLAHAPQFEKIGVGRFRLRADATPAEPESDAPA